MTTIAALVEAAEAAEAAAPSPPWTILYLDHTAKLSGGEIALARLLGELDPVRVRPVVLLAEDGPLVARLREDGIETHVLPLPSGVREVRKDTLGLTGLLKNVAKAGHLAHYAVQVARFAQRCGANVLHCNSLKADVYGALAGRLARLPVIWHVRDHIDPSYLPTPAVRAFRMLARRLPSYVVTNSQSTLERLDLNGACPTMIAPSGYQLPANLVVHDGLGMRELSQSTADAAWPALIRVALVGRLAPWKGQHVFLEAAQQVRRAGWDACFTLVGSAMFGEDAYESRLRQIVADAPNELGGGRVIFAGFQNDVFAALRQTDILVHASTTPEPFGQVVVEGMAVGLPVIGTDGGGVREIIQHGETGLLIPMDDAPALARALIDLMTDPGRARKIGNAGREHVRAHFTAAHAARKIEQVYATLMRDKHGGPPQAVSALPQRD